MSRGLLLALALVALGCPPTHTTDIAAPQMYRPPNATEQWRIEGVLDTEHPAMTRTLKVTINGETVVDGPLPTDAEGISTGTLDGKYQGAAIHVDCSSQRKNETWVEIRCRVLVNNEQAATLIM